MDVLRQLDGLRLPASVMRGAAVAARRNTLHGQRPNAERIAERRGDGLEFEDALRFRHFVDAVDARDVLLFKVVGHTFIRREHEFLDQAVRGVPLGACDAAHQALLVELDLRLGQVKIDAAAVHALAVEQRGEVAHQLERRDERRIALAQSRVPFEHAEDIGVRHALLRADDTLAQLEADDLGVMIELHDAGEHEPVEVRAQAAYVCRELERQHGHGAVGEVDAGAAQARFVVDGHVRADVVRHIGNVDLQLEVAVGQVAHGDGVVEVARCLAVDGDDREAAKVAAMAEFACGNDFFDALRLVQHGVRKAMRDVVLADDDLDVDAEIVFVTEYLDYAAARWRVRRRPLGDFDVDDDIL